MMTKKEIDELRKEAEIVCSNAAANEVANMRLGSFEERNGLIKQETLEDFMEKLEYTCSGGLSFEP